MFVQFGVAAERFALQLPVSPEPRRMTTKPSLRDSIGIAAVPSSARRNELVARGPRVGQVLAGWLAAAHASGRERLEPAFRVVLDVGTCRSTLEGLQSRHGDAQSFPEALQGDPYT